MQDWAGTVSRPLWISNCFGVFLCSGEPICVEIAIYAQRWTGPAISLNRRADGLNKEQVCQWQCPFRSTPMGSFPFGAVIRFVELACMLDLHSLPHHQSSSCTRCAWRGRARRSQDWGRHPGFRGGGQLYWSRRSGLRSSSVGTNRTYETKITFLVSVAMYPCTGNHVNMYIGCLFLKPCTLSKLRPTNLWTFPLKISQWVQEVVTIATVYWI